VQRAIGIITTTVKTTCTWMEVQTSRRVYLRRPNPRLYSLTRSSAGAYQLFRNALNLNSGAASNSSTFQFGIANGGNSPGESSKEYVSELIQYDRDLTAPELNKVHSYLPSNTE